VECQTGGFSRHTSQGADLVYGPVPWLAPVPASRECLPKVKDFTLATTAAKCDSLRTVSAFVVHQQSRCKGGVP